LARGGCSGWEEKSNRKREKILAKLLFDFLTNIQTNFNVCKYLVSLVLINTEKGGEGLLQNHTSKNKKK
jgi:hypothetical protein